MIATVRRALTTPSPAVGARATLKALHHQQVTDLDLTPAHHLPRVVAHLGLSAFATLARR